MKTIIVTGSTGGLGQALVDEIYKCGYRHLICMYRNQKKYNELIGEKYEKITGLHTKKNEDIENLLRYVTEKGDSEVVIFLTAFEILPLKKIGTYSHDEVSQMVDGNIKDNVFIINEVVKICKTHEISLRVVNIDSGAADHALQGWGQYCASKAYINSFLNVLALENPDYKVVCVDPGVIDTNMQRKIRETSKSVFDRVNEFIEYKDNNILRKASDVAKILTDQYLTHWNASSFREKLVK